MTSKKVVRALQIETHTQGELDEVLQLPGLTVVDAYAAWCGPCKAIRSLLNKIRITLDRDDLIYATAETDSIESLAAYRGKSEPTFLFYGNGVLMNVLRGCSAPLMSKNIHNLLKQEAQIAEGLVERREFVDLVVAREAEEKSDAMKDVEEEEEVEAIALPVVVVKPDVVDVIDEITETIVGGGFEIAHRVDRELTIEEVIALHHDEEGSETYEQLVELMTSGPCVVLALAKPVPLEEMIADLVDLIGPGDVNTAKEEHPESVRAKFANDSVHNAVVCSASVEQANQHTALFFPSLLAPSPRKQSVAMETTVAIIRPHAIAQKEAVLAVIGENGFEVTAQKEVEFTKELVEELYVSRIEAEDFESLLTVMTSGMSVVMCLQKDCAVEEWQKLLTPPTTTTTTGDELEGVEGETDVDESEPVPAAQEEAEGESDATVETVEAVVVGLQVQFAATDDISSCEPLHGSLTVEDSQRELNLLFPHENISADDDVVGEEEPPAEQKPSEEEPVVAEETALAEPVVSETTDDTEAVSAVEPSETTVEPPVEDSTVETTPALEVDAPHEESAEESAPVEPSVDVTPSEEPPSEDVTTETVQPEVEEEGAPVVEEPVVEAEQTTAASGSESTTTADGETDVSREATLDEKPSESETGDTTEGGETSAVETSREPTLEEPTSTEVSREGTTTTEASDTDATTTDATTTD